MFKFGQKEVTSKEFYRERQMADIFTIDVNKVGQSLIKCNAIMERAVITL